MLNFFARGAYKNDTATYFKEPTLGSPPSSSPAAARPGPARPAPAAAADPETPPEPAIPTDYAGLVAYFEKTVSQRKSPYNALVQAAERLQEFIPDEIGRLKAAYTLNGDRWSPELLSLAISTHLSDVDRAWEKARSQQGSGNRVPVEQLRAQIKDLQDKNAGIERQVAALQEEIQRHRSALDANQAEITSLSQQLQLFDGAGNAATYLDQAAENLKNDLLAKKVLLGLS